LVVRTNCDKEQVELLVMVRIQRLHDMIPTERKESSLALS
jgi:hypothetical protein